MTTKEPEYIKFKLLSIDAWRDECGWYWNNCFTLEEDIFIVKTEITPRKIAAMLRKWNYLSEYSKGQIRVDMHPEYCELFIEICDKGTGKPLLALSTIH